MGRKRFCIRFLWTFQEARLLGFREKAEVESVVFDRVEQNPLTTTAMEAAAFIRQEKCDTVIGLGGGSIMDCAKAAAF